MYISTLALVAVLLGSGVTEVPEKAIDVEEVIGVGDTTEHTIDLSKDNWFFGVRAYDQDGHRSLVSFPKAARE